MPGILPTSSTAPTTAPRFSRDDLHAYQRRAVAFIKAAPCCALWVDMGLGKTVSTLTAVADLLDSFAVARVLVIAPMRVAQTTWPAEIARWTHTRHLSATVLRGGPAERAALVAEDRADIHLISRDLVVWLVDLFKKRKAEWPYDMVVIDEASSFKSPGAKRFKALRRMRPQIDRMVQLTGTPASNGLLDVWSQAFLLDGGARLGRTFSGFRARFFVSDFHGYNWFLRRGADERIHDALRDVVLTLSAEDYLDLPERIDRTVGVTLPAAARRQYRDLEKDFLAEIGDDTVAVFNAAALSNKLLQFANGAIYTDDAGAWAAVHDAKLDALAELVDEAAGAPLLVAVSYRTDAARIRARFPQAVEIGKDPATMARWNAGEIPLLLAHPASAGHGLNLQAGGDTAVWFGLNWSLELYQQFNARLHRQGQTRPVVIHHIVAGGTVDETVLAALSRKDVTQRALLDALKRDATERLDDRDPRSPTARKPAGAFTPSPRPRRAQSMEVNGG